MYGTSSPVDREGRHPYQGACVGKTRLFLTMGPYPTGLDGLECVCVSNLTHT